MTNSIMRLLLGMLAGYLLNNGYLKPDQRDLFISYATTAAGSLIALVSLFWSFFDRRFSQYLMHLALRLPSTATTDDLKVIAARELAGRSLLDKLKLIVRGA